MTYRMKIWKHYTHCNLDLKNACRKLEGLIRNEPFDPKMWIIHGDHMEAFHEVQLSTATKVFTRGIRKIKSKVIADVVEALIGVYLSCGGEVAALSVMTWLGVEVPQCYHRLEFLGDSVVDYLVTMHLYNIYPGMSPGLLTDLRSASVNNDCYSLSAVKVGLQKHILHASKKLQEQIDSSVQNLDPLLMGSTFGWESENSLPKVLGDIIESIAGAILVDSGYKKDIVFKSILPLLEPLVSPETLKLQPVVEAERDSARDFQPLPFDYVEIARLLFDHAHASYVLILFPKQ
ncbi:hypothetical protein POM88_006865 [Heracleum sosnowskyi]|uniref:RNase III domain-containing protein n=1 Tax=Heracleum sosnowskyi TaxID=360622 RepID=A0AAD8J6U0_9APIA|nr:hypothetical protein POM88_006865 [Heracleum sosnowskyi]